MFTCQFRPIMGEVIHIEAAKGALQGRKYLADRYAERPRLLPVHLRPVAWCSYRELGPCIGQLGPLIRGSHHPLGSIVELLDAHIPWDWI